MRTSSKRGLSLSTSLLLALSLLMFAVQTPYRAEALDFGTPINLSDNATDSDAQQVVASGSNVFVMWTDDPPMNCCILLSVSTDSGASFGDPVNIAGRQPQIAVSGSYVFITYVDQGFSGDVFVVVSDDNGATFGTPENISNSAGDSLNPQIAVSGNNVFVTYEDDTSGNSEVFVAASTDSGDNFGTPENISNNLGYSGVINFGSALTIAASGSNVFVTWEDNTPGNNDVFFARSTDTGMTFNQINLSNSAASSFDPRMAISGSNVFVVWSELIDGDQFDIKMKKSADGGTSFGSKINISNNAGGSSGSQIAASGSNLYVMWTDSTPGNGDILVRTSIDSGDNFGTTINVSNNAGTSGGVFLGQKITAIANNVFVTWADSTPGNTDIFIAESTDYGASFGDGINVSDTALGSADPHVAVSGSNQIVTWTESTPDIGDNAGPSEVYYVTNLITPQPGIIAFYSGPDFSEDVYVMDTNGDNRINVSDDPASDADPALSPDGTKIAFTSFRDGNYEIYVMDADGDNQMNVSNDPASDYYPNWSPDGTKIAFTRYLGTELAPNEQVWVMDADGNNQMPLTPTEIEFDESRPAFSPDGEKIAFSSTVGGNWDVYVMDSNGDRDSLINLSDNYAFESDAAFSPDGSQIAFTSDRDGNFEVYVMDSDDGDNQVNLSENDAWDALPSWSPDGSQIAFHSTRDGTFQIFLMEADGDLPTNISNNEEDDSDPSWALVADVQPTSLTLNPLHDVTATTGYTVSGELTNDGEGISGQLITFDGDGVTPSLQSVMTEGVTFAGTIDIVACPTPVVHTPTTCTTDNVGDDDTTSENMVLHLGDDGKMRFPASTVTAKIYLQDMGTSSFKYIVEEGDGTLQPEATSAGAESPVVPVLSIVSGYTDGDPNGLKELTITEITGGTSVGIAAVLTGNPDGLPVEQHQINFEEFAAGSKTSPFTVNAGFYFSTGFAQNLDAEGLEITAHFAGTSGFTASDSTTEPYDVLANTAGLGGEGSQGLGGAVGTSITTLDCNTEVGSVDSDNDGICDLWETAGITLGTANFPLVGAAIGQKDIFVEIDCMTGFCPTAADLTAVRNAFSAEGFTLHISTSDVSLPVAIPAATSPFHVWTDGDGSAINDFDSVKKANFGTAAERTAAGGTLGQGRDLLEAKAQVYHYGLFVRNINTGTSTACGPSGQAELSGNDFIVSVGCTGTNGFQNSAQERQGTLMHELGHNLGLRHGGGDDDNCKANLISVMSYTRQMPWGSLSATTTGSNPTEWALTYSRQDLSDLSETNLQEGAGLSISTGQWGGTLASGSSSFKIIWGIPAVKTGSTGNTVNWNNAAGNTASLNINTLSGMLGCTGTVKSTLKSYNEWAILDLNFRDGGTIDGLVYPDEDTVAELTPPVLAGAEAASVVGPKNVFNNIGLSALPDVATDADDNIYVVWSEKASFSSSFEIYFSRSLDDGATFSPPENISNNAGNSLTPRIEESDGILYVVWSDKTGGTSNNYDIRFSKSSNMGDDWDPSVKLSSNSGDSLTPAIAASGSDVYVVWSDKTGGTSSKFDIQFKKSDNGGASFTPNTASGNKVSSNSGESLTPDVDVSSSGIFVVWSDTSGGTSSKFDILMKKSTDGGTSFLPNTANAKNISTNSGHSLTPSLAVDGDNVYVTWSDTTGGTSGNFDILFKKSTDGGNSFTPNTANAKNISTTSSLSATPRIVASSGSIYIAWSDNGVSGRFDIFVKKSGDSGENFEAAQNISGNSGHSLTPAIALTGPVLNLVWGDLTPGITGDIMYASRIV